MNRLVWDLRDTFIHRCRLEQRVQQSGEHLEALRRGVGSTQSAIERLTRYNEQCCERIRQLQQEVSTAPDINALTEDLAAASEYILQLQSENEQLMQELEEDTQLWTQLEEANGEGSAGRGEGGRRGGRGGRAIGGNAVGQGRGMEAVGLDPEQ